MEDELKETKISQIYIKEKKAKIQNKIEIEEIKIYFPYEPYPEQLKYMKKVILTLKKKGSISALESPTGTGKTLCLLCAVLVWINSNELENINIYYCTRTISQIKNVMKELNKTCYIFKSSFLASRKYSCLTFSKSKKIEYDIAKLNDLCNYYRKNNYCKYYKDPKKYNYFNYNNLKDIEDLFKEGTKKEFCPYFYNLKKTDLYANITFMPYNYILNPFIRNRLKIIHENSIIILDEAHNINNIFENLYSKKIKKKALEKTQILLQLFLNYKNTNSSQIIEDKSYINPLFNLKIEEINVEINNLKTLIKNLENLNPENDKLCKKIDDNINKNYFLCKIDYFKDIFKSLSFVFYHELDEVINKLDEKEEINLKNYYDKNFDKNIAFKSIIKKPKKIFEFLKELYELKKEEEGSFKFIFSNKEEKNNNFFIKKSEKFFEIYCIDASYGMKDLLKINPYSIILTSGTLSIKMMENLLKVNFKETLNNNHIVKNNQFLANIILSFKKNNTKNNYSFLYKNRKELEQIKSLGNEILNLAKSVKIGGILFFFQSYEYLKFCHKKWLDEKIIGKFELIKNTIFDLKHLKDKNEELIKEGKESNNLLLFTVYRGKNSEGINFPDDEARMVICIGIPYPNLSDIKVKLKKDFLDEKFKKEKKGYRGWQWSREEAMVAVNQSLGRLIRNKDDFGIMICFGIEFDNNKNLFSNWIKKNISYKNLSENDNEFYTKLENFLSNLNLNKINNNSITAKKISFNDENEKEENDYEENDFEEEENDFEYDKNDFKNEESDYEDRKKDFIGKKRKGDILDLDDSSIF